MTKKNIPKTMENMTNKQNYFLNNSIDSTFFHRINCLLKVPNTNHFTKGAKEISFVGRKTLTRNFSILID